MFSTSESPILDFFLLIIWNREFDNDLTLRLYRDEVTEAAKVVCTIGPQYGAGGYIDRRAPPNKFQTFIDASFLTVSRAGSSLHLKRRGILWACLYFADIESTDSTLIIGRI